MDLAANLSPLVRRDQRECRGSLWFLVDVGDVQLSQVGPCRSVDLSTTSDEAGFLGGCLGKLDRLLKGVRDLDSLVSPVRLPGDDDDAPVRQPAGLFMGAAPKDQGVACGHSLEAPEVGGDVPEHVLPGTDHTIVGNGRDCDYPHQPSQASTPALACAR